MSTTLKNQQLANRRRRIRAVVSGSAAHPRLSVNFSRYHVVAQLIDDTKAHTLVYVSTSRGTQLVARQNNTRDLPRVGDNVGVQIDRAAAHVFDAQGRVVSGPPR